MEKHSFDVWSPQLRTRRRIDVYLPDPDGARRFSVVYMQDGQNLSDPAIAFGGRTWQLDVVLPKLAERGVAPIIVGIHHGGERRLAEYSPFPDARHGGGDGDRYIRFVTDTVKPRIDRAYRTRRDPQNTAIVGSSMGGLVALYGFFRRPSPFGRVGALSPSIWFGGGRILTFIEESRAPDGRIYLDAGTAEGAETIRNTRALARILRRKGYQPRDSLRYIEASGHQHREQDWAKRLPDVLEFLLKPEGRHS